MLVLMSVGRVKLIKLELAMLDTGIGSGKMSSLVFTLKDTRLVQLGTCKKQVIISHLNKKHCLKYHVTESYCFSHQISILTDEGSDITTCEDLSTQTFTKTLTVYLPDTVVKNPETGPLEFPSISISVGVTVKENMSHAPGLFCEKNCLFLPDIENVSIVYSEEPIVMLVTSTRYVRSVVKLFATEIFMVLSPFDTLITTRSKEN